MCLRCVYLYPHQVNGLILTHTAETVTLLLSHRAISPNGVHPRGSGITPLHLAASLGRADIVNILLEQEGIDDSIRDTHGKTCREVAKGKDVIKAIEGMYRFRSPIPKEFDS